MSPRRIAIITDEEHPGLRPDDLGLDSAFRELGVEAVTVPWGRVLEPAAFDLALIRSPWDYILRPAAFVDWLAALAVPVVNPVDVLRWNVDKRYLLDLRERSAAEIPATVVIGADERPRAADALLDRLSRGLDEPADRAVLKPVVSGGAYLTLVLSRGDSVQWTPVDVGAYLVQAFVDEIHTSGEWSLTFFDGVFSHAVRKEAKAGDFRVQEEHGGAVLVETPGAAIVREAQRVLDGVPCTDPLAYARVDLVERAGATPLLMELELIEPELFLRVAPGSVERLARATLARA